MQALKSHITREEYLELDAASAEKHEFYQGEILPCRAEHSTTQPSALMSQRLYRTY